MPNTPTPTPQDPRLPICPYFRSDRGQNLLTCECARITFPDKISRREIVYRLCAHPDGYHQCPLKQMLDGYYQRKYQPKPIPTT